MEAVDQSLPSVIRPATVVRVINKLYFIVELDDLTMTSEDRRPGNQLCCHAGSLNIFPVGWCSANNIHLTPVPSRFSSFFTRRTFGRILFFCAFLCIRGDIATHRVADVVGWLVGYVDVLWQNV